MPGALLSIMPGQTRRDTGHKALCPVSALVRAINGAQGGPGNDTKLGTTEQRKALR